jgi:hypothetical protein
MNGKRSARIAEVSPSSLAIWARSVMRAARSRSLPGDGASVAPASGLTPEGSITAGVAVRSRSAAGWRRLTISPLLRLAYEQQSYQRPRL